MKHFKLAGLLALAFGVGHVYGRLKEAVLMKQDLETSFKHNERLILGVRAYHDVLERIIDGEDVHEVVQGLDREKMFIKLVTEQDMSPEEEA